MAASIAKNCTILVDGYDLSCAFKSLNMVKSVDELDTTALCTTGDRSFVPGLKEGTLDLEGYYAYDGTDLDELENVLETAFANQSNVVISASLGALSVGGVAFMVTGGQTSHDVSSVLNQVIMATATIRATGNIYGGQWLYNDTVDDDTDTGSSVDNTAGTTDGGIIHFHAYAPDGDITASEVVIEHSANNSDWDELGSVGIGDGFGAAAAEIPAGTTVNRYLRASVTATDGAATFAASFYRR